MESKIDKAFDINYLLLEYYKKLYLNEEELSVLLMLNHLLEQKNYVLTADLLTLKMSLTSDKIDGILARLNEKKFIELNIADNGQARMSIRPLKDKLMNLFMHDYYILKANTHDEEIQNVYALIEMESACTLNPTEVLQIREWFAQGYTEEDICNAVKDLKSHNRRISVKKLDNKLLQKTKSEEIKLEGKTTITDNYNKDLEETIALTKMKWLEKDE